LVGELQFEAGGASEKKNPFEFKKFGSLVTLYKELIKKQGEGGVQNGGKTVRRS